MVFPAQKEGCKMNKVKLGKVLATEYVVQVPSGCRVLISLGHGLAYLRPAFGPGDSSIASERLTLSHAFESIQVSADGTFINSKHLWSILIGLLKPGESRPLTEFSEILFWQKPDLHSPLMKLFAAFSPDDSYWQGMVTHGYYDPATRTVHRHSRA